MQRIIWIQIFRLTTRLRAASREILRAVSSSPLVNINNLFCLYHNLHYFNRAFASAPKFMAAYARSGPTSFNVYYWVYASYATRQTYNLVSIILMKFINSHGLRVDTDGESTAFGSSTSLHICFF